MQQLQTAPPAETDAQRLARAAGRSAAVANRLAAALIALGAGLRVLRYVQGRSLWLDEVLLANNILHRSLGQLLEPLDYRQGAPVLFLLAEKTAVRLLGGSEWALRLVPLLAGLAALPLFWRVGRRLAGAPAALVGLALLAVAEPAIYYSSELKPYSADLGAALMCMAIPVWLADGPTWRRTLIAAAVGAAAMLFSYPAALVLAGATAALATRAMVQRDRARLGALAAAGSTWLCVGTANYLLFMRHLTGDASLLVHWSRGFPPPSIEAAGWLVGRYHELWSGYETLWLGAGPLAGTWLGPAMIAAAVSLIGWVGLARRDSRAIGVLAGPLAVALAASAVRCYALDGRLIHFAVGAAAIVFGAGIWTLGRVPRRNVRVAAALLALAVLAPSTLRAAKWAAQPPGREEMQTILGWLAPRVEPGDTIYVSHAADAAWLYYRERYGLGQRDWIHGRRPAAGQNTAAADAADLRGRGRVWLIFAHVQEKEDERLLHSLGVAGQPIESTAAPGASAHLYVLD